MTLQLTGLLTELYAPVGHQRIIFHAPAIPLLPIYAANQALTTHCVGRVNVWG